MTHLRAPTTATVAPRVRLGDGELYRGHGVHRGHGDHGEGRGGEEEEEEEEEEERKRKRKRKRLVLPRRCPGLGTLASKDGRTTSLMNICQQHTHTHKQVVKARIANKGRGEERVDRYLASRSIHCTFCSTGERERERNLSHMNSMRLFSGGFAGMSESFCRDAMRSLHLLGVASFFLLRTREWPSRPPTHATQACVSHVVVYVPGRIRVDESSQAHT